MQGLEKPVLRAKNSKHDKMMGWAVRSETLDDLPLKGIKMDPEDATHDLVLWMMPSLFRANPWGSYEALYDCATLCKTDSEWEPAVHHRELQTLKLKMKSPWPELYFIISSHSVPLVIKRISILIPGPGQNRVIPVLFPFTNCNLGSCINS